MAREALLCICPPDSGGLAALHAALPGRTVLTAATLHEAQCLLDQQPCAVGLLIDTIGRAPDPELQIFLSRHSHMHWVGVLPRTVLDSDAHRRLMATHLSDYHTLPVDPDRLRFTLGHLFGQAALQDDTALPPRLGAMGITGNSPAVQRLRIQIARVARVSAPVLIWGESGSGKELAAQAIHRASARAEGPFVAINCGAIPPNLIQSELFGYERGAFTGATHARAGLIESASGGTIFLDEIADLPREQQANLLRFLQEKTIYRVGATRSVSADARVIAASHVNLEVAVAEGSFREDLYYRLSVLPLVVPPLRERQADLRALADQIFASHAGDAGRRLRGFTAGAHAAMLHYSWPGNVRELINRIRRAIVMCDGRLITEEDLGLAAPPEPAAVAKELGASRERFEREAVTDALRRHGGMVSRAARDLGVSRSTMYRLLDKYGLHGRS
ncbi:sigma-54-dependent Fis family transcriptional regulator [Massilia arenosa]|uniref:Sigma-54-dependent Fis family transcriptional regulator n=1 Tax=Zemynaea arenosa TaxID=2561931 RepID=A0A4Y9SDH7_9BURK|nr:sigma-54 dependent transcriptional regulator [Massilia arenosa]TFW17900.1 sigma-54-dependent Fis family transcriptional regulator [Massilia arenosa]